MTAVTTPALELTAVLLTLVEAELETPGGRDRITDALCRTLRAVGGPGCVRVCPLASGARSRAVLKALDEAARHTSRATDAIVTAEKLAEGFAA